LEEDAMRVKIQDKSPGLHPSEVVVGLRTDEGIERLVVHKRSIKDDGLDIGYPISDKQNQYLIELPRETQSGAWRVWVNKDQVE
jgi:hypothetical protein